MPRVPGHPLNFDNGCQAPVLRETLGANRPDFLRNFETLLIESATQLSFLEKRADPLEFFELGTRPLKALEPPLHILHIRKCHFLQITYHNICFLY